MYSMKSPAFLKLILNQIDCKEDMGIFGMEWLLPFPLIYHVYVHLSASIFNKSFSFYVVSKDELIII